MNYLFLVYVLFNLRSSEVSELKLMKMYNNML